MVTYYHKFIDHFAERVAPLYVLTSKNVTWNWTEECEIAFNDIREAMTHAPVLRMPDLSQPFVLQTDASDIGLGGVLSQRHAETKEEWVIAYASRVLRKAEKNYTTTEKECLAIVWAVREFRAYLWGVPLFHVETDHSALSWLDRMREPTGRLARWIMALQEYRFTITHRAGKNNQNADALSRSGVAQVNVITRRGNYDPSARMQAPPRRRGLGNNKSEEKVNEVPLLPANSLNVPPVFNSNDADVVSHASSESAPSPSLSSSSSSSSSSASTTSNEFEVPSSSRLDNNNSSIAQSVMSRRGWQAGPYYNEVGPVIDEEQWEEWPDSDDDEEEKKENENVSAEVETMRRTSKANRRGAPKANSVEANEERREDSEQSEHGASTIENSSEENQEMSLKDGGSTITDLADMRTEQLKDFHLAAIINMIETGVAPPEVMIDSITIEKEGSECVMQNDILMHKHKVNRGGEEREILQVYVPEHMRWNVLREFHDGVLAGHLGVDRTYKAMQDRVYWRGMYSDVQAWIKGCIKCGHGKPAPPSIVRAPIGTLPIATSPFEIVSMDFMGPFQETPRGNRYILVFTDFLTRWPEAVALPESDEVTVARALVEHVICRHGAPSVLLSDRGKQFNSKMMNVIYTLLDIDKRSTTAYRPQCNGITERFNKTIATIMKMYVNADQKDWDLWLPYGLLAYRIAYHEVLKETPFFLLYGRHPRLPIDLALHTPTTLYRNLNEYTASIHERFDRAHALAIDALKAESAEREKENEHIHPHVYGEGDRVYLFFPQIKKHRTKKLTHRWSGPWQVLRRVTAVQYEVEEEGGGRRQMVHVTRMKPYIDRKDMDRLNRLAEAAERERNENPEEKGMEH